ncbi:SusC/RagA family TonB-linked outer membrane protein [Mucilaginibacter ginsenosidivorax]|uniref:SusC/RagA family TonB-linked outer membrane protein n=1 Tax=Mucilaginibacter ginsenosidivorax TaxID=862126 RepID=A0A5B8VU65_9SPHI|nr:SusC/RagA family TonB-linked outer membrane protein [Mucilaginibacter ginsenosidivorax]QEC74671.1 SusC/RagA family TonB-linked outer membrane protein [Mucilaginibacter ginsenosidivorax]
MTYLYKILCGAWLCCLLQVCAHAQGISGQVQDPGGRPIADVWVSVKSKQLQATTGADGRFTIAAQAHDTLTFTKAGYLPKTVLMHGEHEFKITMRLALQQMDEIKIVSNGYKSIPLENATGSYEQVGKELLNRSPGTNVLARLDGVSSILFDRRTGHEGEPGIRGRSTLFANASPLVILDNFPYEGDLNNLNPNDVDGITILKDASAAAIWGVRASNGVIVITTKKGLKNKPLAIGFNASVTVAAKPDAFYLPQMSPSDFIGVEKQLFAQGFYNDDEQSVTHTNLSPAVEVLIAQRDGQITAGQADQQLGVFAGHDLRNDLQKYWYHQAVNQQYALNLSGGTERVTYYFSAGYDHNLDALQGNYRRLNLRSDNNFTLGTKLKLDAGVYFTDSKTMAGRNDPSTLVSADGKQLYPYARLADDRGNALPVALDYRQSFTDASKANGFLDWSYTPLSDYRNTDNHSDQLNLLLNTALHYTIGGGLEAEVRYQLEAAQNNGTLLYGQDSYYARNVVNRYTQTAADGSLTRPVPAGGIMNSSDSRFQSNNLRVQLNYRKAWEQHQLTALAGYEYRNDQTTTRNFRDYGYNADIGQGMPVDYTTSFALANQSYQGVSTIPYGNNFGSFRNYNLSWYGNLAYAYGNRYSVSASARRDESNLFGVNANQKGVPLYSAGLAWTASNEAFYHLTWLPYLKIRLTYGYSGNVDNTLSAEAAIRYIGTSNIGHLTYASVANPPNPDLGWEKTGILNAAVDFTVAGGILSGSVEAYSKKGHDLIGFRQADQTTGVLNPATNLFQYKGNVAAMKGKGIELNLHAHILRRVFGWQTDLLFNYARNTVTSYDQTSNLGYNYVATGITVSPLEGKPLYSILTYKWAGLDPQTGNPRGYIHGVISSDAAAIIDKTTVDELQYSGPAVPPAYGNLRNTFSYRGWSVSANLSYRFGYYWTRYGIAYDALAFSRSNQSNDYASRWQKAGDEQHTNVPSFTYPTDSSRDQFYNQSSVNVEKGDHIRLQDVRLAYEPGEKQLRRFAIKHLQVYLYAANLGIIWKATKTSLDPDYPYSIKPARTIAIGLSGNF